MKQFYVIAGVLIAAFTMSVAVVAEASAVEFLLALWVESGKPIAGILPVETEGELELVGLNAGNLKIVVKILCDTILDGWVQENSLDFVSEILTLAGGSVSRTALVSPTLKCTNVQNCVEPEVWATKLGWETEVELMVDGGETFFVDLFFGLTWYAQCLVLGSTINESCEYSELVGKMTNEPNGEPDTEFSDAFQELGGLALGTCTMGGNLSAELNGLTITLETGVSIDVSSE